MSGAIRLCRSAQTYSKVLVAAGAGKGFVVGQTGCASVTVPRVTGSTSIRESDFRPHHSLPGLLVNASQVGFTALASDIGASARVKATFFLTRPGISRTGVGNGGQNSSKFGSTVGRETARTGRNVGRRWGAAAEAGNDAVGQWVVRIRL